MKNRFWLILMGLLLVGGLWMVSINSASAQEEEATQEVTETLSEEAENTNAGPGAFIILVGLGAVLIIGLTYMARQNNNAVSPN